MARRSNAGTAELSLDRSADDHALIAAQIERRPPSARLACPETSTAGFRCRSRSHSTSPQRDRRRGSARSMTALSIASPAIEQDVALRRNRLVGAGHELRPFLAAALSAPCTGQDRALVGIEIDHVFVAHDHAPAAAMASPSKSLHGLAAFHCIGVRQPSRPTPIPGTFFSKGSRTWSGAIAT